MKELLIGILLSILLFGCNGIKGLVGYYEEQYTGPSTSVYYFDSNGFFEEYVHADLASYYSRGNYLLNGNKLTLNFDSIYVDSSIVIERKVGDSDSIEISLLLYDDIWLDTNMFIYSELDSGLYYRIPGYSWLSSPYFYEKPLLIDIRVPKGNNDMLNIRFFDGMKRFRYEIIIETNNSNFLKVEYFPTGGNRMKFNSNEDDIVKLKRVDSNLIEFKYKRYGHVFGYSKIPAP